MTTITWKVTDMLRNISDGLVTRVDWEAVAVDGSTEIKIRGMVFVSRTESFTPFEQVTEEQVLAWVKACPKVAHIEGVLKRRVAAVNSPVTTASGVPWATQQLKMPEQVEPPQAVQ